MEYIVSNSEDMDMVAHSVRTFLKGKGEKGATTLGLSGDLGSGKTTFTQALARELGVQERVTSPTFGIMRMYDTSDSLFPKLVHIDAYRLEGGEDMKALDWDDLVVQPGNLIVIEWPEHIKDILPHNTRILSFSHVDNTTRRISVVSPHP